MTTIIIEKGTYRLDTKILQDLGYVLKGRHWSKKIEISQIRDEIEKLRLLKIPNIEVLLD